MNWARYSNPQRLPNSHTVKDIARLRRVQRQLVGAYRRLLRHRSVDPDLRDEFGEALGHLDVEIERLDASASR